MSVKISNRSKAREALMQMLFQMEFQDDFSDEAKARFIDGLNGEDTDIPYIDATFNAYISHNNEIDDLIEACSRGWKIDRIAKVDLTIMRVCISEILYLNDKTVPRAASINEAVRIAKKYSGDDSGSFVNGILGKIAREHPEAVDEG